MISSSFWASSVVEDKELESAITPAGGFLLVVNFGLHFDFPFCADVTTGTDLGVLMDEASSVLCCSRLNIGESWEKVGRSVSKAGSSLL